MLGLGCCGEFLFFGGRLAWLRSGCRVGEVSDASHKRHQRRRTGRFRVELLVEWIYLWTKLRQGGMIFRFEEEVWDEMVAASVCGLGQHAFAQARHRMATRMGRSENASGTEERSIGWVWRAHVLAPNGATSRAAAWKWVHQGPSPL